MSHVDAGVYRQLENFRRDYEDGEAIAQEYLRLINHPEYLTTSGHEKLGNTKRKRICGNNLDKYQAAAQIFPGCRQMNRSCVSHKMRRLGYGWDAKLRIWSKISKLK